MSAILLALPKAKLVLCKSGRVLEGGAEGADVGQNTDGCLLCLSTIPNKCIVA